MNPSSFFAGTVAALASAIFAQPIPAHAKAGIETTVVCVDANGGLRPAVCRTRSSRLDHAEDICLCRIGQRITVPVCPAGVRAPPESPAVERARRDILAHRGDLVGASWRGRPMCVARAG